MITYKNSVERIKTKKGLKSVYYDENGNITTDENKIKNIEREIKLNLGGRNYIGNSGVALTNKEYEAAKSLIAPEANTQEGIITPQVEQVVNEIKNKSLIEQQKKEAEIAKSLEEQGAFKEIGKPQNLQEAAQIKEDALINSNIPSLNAKTTEAALNYIDLNKIKNMSFEDFINTPEYKNSDALKSLIKNKLDYAIYKSGEAKVSSLGVLVEGIPLISGVARKYGGNLLETPSGKIDTIVKELSSLEGDIREQGNAATIGADTSLILENMNKYEDRILWLEGKLKILISQSPELRSNPEEIDLIMTQIQGIYNRINDARAKVALSTIKTTEQANLGNYQGFLSLQKYKEYLD